MPKPVISPVKKARKNISFLYPSPYPSRDEVLLSVSRKKFQWVYKLSLDHYIFQS